MSLIFIEAARDSGEPPVAVRLMKLGGVDAFSMKTGAKLFQFEAIANREIDERGMVVRRSTKRVNVLNCRMCGLNSLLCQR